MNDLDVLYPEGKTVIAKGEVITILPFGFGMLPTVTKKLLPLVELWTEAELVSFTREGETVSFKISDDIAARVLPFMEAGGEQFMDLVAYLAKKSRAWLDTVPPHEGVELVKALFEVNADYFTKKILPMLPGQAPTLATSDGAISSVGSSQQVTDVPISTATL